MRLRDIGLLPKIDQAIRLNARNPRTAVFVTTLLRPREIKLATALRRTGWKVILLYKRTTPFVPEKYFDIAIRARTDALLHRVAKIIQPRVCHVFSGAIDETVLNFCRDKPGPVVIDLNDIFAPSLFNYLHERFEPTREALSLADGLVCRDLQAKFAERMDGFKLPPHLLFFPEYSWIDGPSLPNAKKKRERDEVHVVSIGTFTLESDKMYDSAYLQMARMLAERRIHFHIYPHWFFQDQPGSVFRFDPKKAFADFYALEAKSPYIHMHKSLPVEKLARELPQYDFGLIAGGSKILGQKLNFLTENYMKSCYSGRIADYLDARLPIIINPEVEFNYKFLRRYGISFDLSRIRYDNFRDDLMSAKHDSALRKKVDEAAQTLALDINSDRLGSFYEAVAAGATEIERFPSWLRVAIRLPVIGHRLKRIRDLAATVPELKAEVRRLTAEQSRTKLVSEHNISRLKETTSRTEDELSRLKGVHIGEKDTELRRTINKLREEVSALEATRAELTAGNQRLHAELIGKRETGRLRDDLPDMSHEDASELVGLLGWKEMGDSVERDQGYAELSRIIGIFLRRMNGGANRNLSGAWALLNRKHLDELLRDGFRRFKRTIALNYFTFPVQKGDPQIAALEKLAAKRTRSQLLAHAESLPDDPRFDLPQQVHFRYHLLLLHSYAARIDSLGLLKAIEEPLVGDPIFVSVDGKRVSQDLANSVVEYYSIREGGKVDDARRILEIGGGYGRDAFVFKRAHPLKQYVMLDIPPALYVAQRYLSTCFPGETVFKVRDFADFEEVRAEFEASSVAFLLPHQINLLPNDYFDIVINISSFGEMTADQISEYFDQIDRIGRGQFYTKQWRESHNPFDGLILKQEDFPVKKSWQTVFSRPCPTQDMFFEALYDLRGGKQGGS